MSVCMSTFLVPHLMHKAKILRRWEKHDDIKDGETQEVEPWASLGSRGALRPERETLRVGVFPRLRSQQSGKSRWDLLEVLAWCLFLSGPLVGLQTSDFCPGPINKVKGISGTHLSPFLNGAATWGSKIGFWCWLLVGRWSEDERPIVSNVRAGRSCVVHMRVPNPSPVLDKNLAPWVQEYYPVLGLGIGETLLWYFQTPVLYFM